MRAVVYVRVSTSEQVGNFSLATQERACREYCAREGIDVERVFVEEGESAKTADRPRLQEALDYCRVHRRRVDYFVVYNVSRLARNLHDHTMIRLALERLGIRLRAVTETFDESAAGKLVENMLAVIAQFDNDARAARTIEGMRAALSRGRWTHQPPLGYRKPPDRRGTPSLVSDPDRADLVRLAFDRIATGRHRTHEVLAELTALGLRSRRGKPLSAQSFGSLLRNPIYAGRVRVAKWGIEGPGDFEALVRAEAFSAAQAVLDGRKPSVERRHRDHPDFPLRRFVRCGGCGAPVTGSWSRGRSSRYAYYRCPNRACRSVQVRKERLEEEFLRELGSLSVRPEVLTLVSEIVRDVWRDRHAETLDRRKRLEERLRGLQERKHRVVDAYLHDGRLDEATYREQCERLTAETNEIQAQLLAIGPEQIDLDGALRFAQRVLTNPVRCWERLAAEQRPAFQHAIYPDGLRYRDGSFGTAESSWAFGYLREWKDSKDAVASPAGFEPSQY